MGVAVFAGETFRIDPVSIAWTFNTKTNDTYTVGGKVIQVFGTSISDMTVEGEFGKGGWQQQQAFLERMFQIAKEQAHAGKVSRSSRPPARFAYPPRGWDFLCYLKGYENPQGGQSVILRADIFNPKWRLILSIVEDASALGLKKVAQDAYVARLAKGIGWKQTEYNGPALTNPPVGGTNVLPTAQPDDPGGNVFRGMGNQGSDVTRWGFMVSKHFPDNWKQMLCIMKYESGGNPNAINQKGSSARGLFQVMATVWANTKGVSFDDLYDPEINTRIAREIYDSQGYQAWPNTSRKCRNDGVI